MEGARFGGRPFLLEDRRAPLAESEPERRELVYT